MGLKWRNKMKIKLSKSKWEEMGRKAGWNKEAQASNEAQAEMQQTSVEMKESLQNQISAIQRTLSLLNQLTNLDDIRANLVNLKDNITRIETFKNSMQGEISSQGLQNAQAMTKLGSLLSGLNNINTLATNIDQYITQIDQLLSMSDDLKKGFTVDLTNLNKQINDIK